MFLLAGQDLREPLGGKLRHGVSAPERFADPADAAARKDDGRIVRLMQQRQADLGNGKGRSDVHDLLPHRGIVLFDAVSLPEDASIVDQAVETAEFLRQAVGERRVDLAAG